MTIKHVWRAVLVAALVHVGACATQPTDDLDPELTPAEIAELPDGLAPDHDDLAALLAQEQPQPDADSFDTTDVEVPVDEPGTDDDVDASTDSAPFQVNLAVLKFGIHPRASDAFRAAGVPAWRIMQTIGNAAASAGTHAQDGTFNGHPYSAATDISVSGLSSTQIKNLLERLGRLGFAAWYRNPGHDGWPSSEVRHIHAVWANCKMKSSLRSQIRSWLVGRNGLVSNTLYSFYHWSTTAKAAVRHKFGQSASGTTNGGSDCFVGGAYCGGDKVSGDKNTLYRCTGSGAPTVIKHCTRGCSVNSGDDDSCK